MNKKFELTKETKSIYSNMLYRIIALKDFGCVKKGELGGWVESEENLSQEGNCWIFDDAVVFNNARVFDNAMIYDDGFVCQNAQVYGKARLYGGAQVCGNAKVHGSAILYNNAYVSDNAEVFDNASIGICGTIGGDAKICGSAETIAFTIIKSGVTSMNRDFVTVGPFGPMNSTLTYQIPSDTVCGEYEYFTGTLDNFKEELKVIYKNDKDSIGQYNEVIKFFESLKKKYHG